ncbi:hypothetical protein FC99_GL001498 [Levilactobacillus koreensis JCM 16448]|nr:hypothetical protein FC99_GL001498 [Levilactobacillus koreensis JCM 16448]
MENKPNKLSGLNAGSDHIASIPVTASSASRPVSKAVTEEADKELPISNESSKQKGKHRGKQKQHLAAAKSTSGSKARVNSNRTLPQTSEYQSSVQIMGLGLLLSLVTGWLYRRFIR